jgi:hypothetical protein
MKTGKRHTLLVFRTRYRQQRGLYFVAALALFGLYLLLNLLPIAISERVEWLVENGWLLLVLGVLIFIVAGLRWIASATPYVQCTARNIKIQTPFYPIAISYKRLKETRPNTLFHVFSSVKLSRAERNTVLTDKTGGHTALVVEMNSWPMSVRWMKFWMSRLMFTADQRGLVLWVEDWMTLNRELNDFKDRWRERRLGRDEGTPASLYSQVMRDK